MQAKNQARWYFWRMNLNLSERLIRIISTARAWIDPKSQFSVYAWSRGLISCLFTCVLLCAGAMLLSGCKSILYSEKCVLLPAPHHCILKLQGRVMPFYNPGQFQRLASLDCPFSIHCCLTKSRYTWSLTALYQGFREELFLRKGH